MGLLDRVSRLVRSNVSSLIHGAEDPEKVLQQTVIDMQSDLLSMRQAVAQAIATQKRTERQCQQAQRTAQEWYGRAQLALNKGDEATAHDALTRRQSYLQTEQALAPQITQQRTLVQQLKGNMNLLAQQLSEARNKKDMYLARARAARSSVRLNQMMNQNATGPSTAFERMETRVLELEAQAEVTGELGNASLERKFASARTADQRQRPARPNESKKNQRRSRLGAKIAKAMAI